MTFSKVSAGIRPGSVRIEDVQDFLLQLTGAHEVEGIGVRPIDDLSDKFLHLTSRLGLPIGKLAIKFFGDCRHK